MSFTKKNDGANAPEVAKVDYKVTVLSAKVINEKRVLFSANVNGIKVDGFALVEYTNQQKETNYLIQFPSRKGTVNGEDKYFNIVWFPISKELREGIVKQIFSLIG